MISLADTDSAIAACFPVMAQLRPHLVPEADAFVTRVRAMQTEGYRLAALTDAAGTVRAVAGFRIADLLAYGRALYVDDLVTDASTRSAGHGRDLLAWLENHARAAGCVVLHLDSGTQRRDAHRFYFRERLTVTSFHFVKPL